MNLLNETIEILKEHNKTLEDIVFITEGNHNSKVNSEQLTEILNVYYDSGFGSTEIKEELKLVGNNFWLERHEYDGSEWWEYKELPIYESNKENKYDKISIKSRVWRWQKERKLWKKK